MSSRISATLRNTSPGTSGTTSSSRSARVVIIGHQHRCVGDERREDRVGDDARDREHVTGTRKSVRMRPLREADAECGHERQVRRLRRVDVGELDDVARGVADEGGAHRRAEVLAARSGPARTSTPRADELAIVSSQASAGHVEREVRETGPGAHLLDRAEVDLGGAELEPGALGAGAEVGTGEHGEAEDVAIEAERGVEVVDHDRDVAVPGDGDRRCFRGHGALPSVADQRPEAYSSARSAQLVDPAPERVDVGVHVRPARRTLIGPAHLRGCSARRQNEKATKYGMSSTSRPERAAYRCQQRVPRREAGDERRVVVVGAQRVVAARPTWRARSRRRRADRRACRSPSRAPRGSRRARSTMQLPRRKSPCTTVLSVCSGMCAASTSCTRSTAGTSRVLRRLELRVPPLELAARRARRVARGRRARPRRRRRRAARRARRPTSSPLRGAGPARRAAPRRCRRR